MNDIFEKAKDQWRNFGAFRSERARCKRYVYGDQWDDPLNLGTHTVSEREFILQQGQVPLKNNILRRILRNVIGLYRSQYKVPLLSSKDSGLKGAELRAENRRRREWFLQNRMEELAPRLLEEFLISGLVAVKIIDGHIQPVTPDNFFFHSDGYDPRGYDVDMIGEVHRVGLPTLFERFCETADDYRRIAALHKEEGKGDGACGLTEVWVKETQLFGVMHDESSGSISIGSLPEILSGIKKDGDAAGVRSFVRSGWRQLWFAHDGTLLRQGELQERQPYVFKAYPFLDGEVHSYISDIIDQQRYVNRLITLYDFIMKSSAKGVLLFPDESLPAGMDLQDVANEWSRFNGVIPYRAKQGVPMPTQVSSNAANIGISELLKIEMQMLEDISGVSPTLQGKLVTNSTSGTLFSQQNEAAQTSLLDVISSFTDFLAACAEGNDQ